NNSVSSDADLAQQVAQCSSQTGTYCYWEPYDIYNDNRGMRYRIYSHGEPPPPSCAVDTISGSGISNGAGVYDVGGCAYTCGTNYSLLDGFTSLADAQECVGTGQEYVSSDPSD